MNRTKRQSDSLWPTIALFVLIVVAYSLVGGPDLDAEQRSQAHPRAAR
jgi:hypothetical protein